MRVVTSNLQPASKAHLQNIQIETEKVTVAGQLNSQHATILIATASTNGHAMMTCILSVDMQPQYPVEKLWDSDQLCHTLTLRFV